MPRKLRRSEIEKRLQIAAAFAGDEGMTYAAAKARFQTSTRVVTSALSRAPAAWRAMLGEPGPGGASPSPAGQYQVTIREIREKPGSSPVQYQTREEGATAWEDAGRDEPLGIVLDTMVKGGLDLVSVVARGDVLLAIFKQAV